MENDDYFKSYNDLRVHELMLKDTVRNRAYRRAIQDNRARIAGKIVMDLGTGTGLLAVMCAQMGAATVYAIEAGDTYRIAEEIVRENNLERTIKIVHSALEQVELPEKCDVIVSEWMGFYLVHEGMLDSLILARDRFLKPNGLLLPESATLYCAPCSVPSLYDRWEDVEGVAMNSFGQRLRRDSAQKPIIMTLKPENLLGELEVIQWFDLREITRDDIDEIRAKQLFVVTNPGKYQGICLSFSCTFPSLDTEPVVLSTEPGEEDTHWHQAVVVLPQTTEILEKGVPLAYELVLKTDGNSRRKYQIELEILDPESVEHPEYCHCHLTKCILMRAMLEKYEKNS